MKEASNIGKEKRMKVREAVENDTGKIASGFVAVQSGTANVAESDSSENAGKKEREQEY
jgi:hypothetical protein